MADKDLKPGPLPAEVLRFWQQKKLVPTFDYTEIWLEENDCAFHAAKVMRVDVLETLHSELGRAITEGLPFDQWARQVEPRFKKLGWWAPHPVADPVTGKIAIVDPPRRLELIFETNMAMAHAAGQWERIQRSKRYRPYVLYLHGNSVNPRVQHLAWHGLLLHADDPFWQSHFPPCGWRCSCHARAMSPREADRVAEEGVPHPIPVQVIGDDGLPTGDLVNRRVPVRREAPPIIRKPWVNPRTGDIELVPEGIDPGFHYLPNEARRRALGMAAE